MSTETLTYVYTSRTEIARLFSETAVQLREDDDDDGTAESGVIQDCVDEATDTINLYCFDWYEAAAMSENLTVRRWATLIGCYLLSQRRGNPAQFKDRYEELIARLERIQTGELHVPRLATKKDFTPGVSNYSINDRFRIKKVRVEQQISTGGRHATQDIDRRQYGDEQIYP